MFYIFMVWNKSLTVHTLVYDMGRNILYEDDDVDVMLLNNEDMEEFLEDAQKKVQKKSHSSKKHRGDTKKEHEDQLSLYSSFEGFEHGSLFDMYDPYELGGRIWKP
jgi:membrane-anchored protein YejM (alkaline phosphatase superfamily)